MYELQPDSLIVYFMEMFGHKDDPSSSSVYFIIIIVLNAIELKVLLHSGNTINPLWKLTPLSVVNT